MPTAFEMRQRNEKFANNVRAGKTAVQPSVRERLKKKSPIGYIALATIGFVLIGGGILQLLSILFRSGSIFYTNLLLEACTNAHFNIRFPHVRKTAPNLKVLCVEPVPPSNIGSESLEDNGARWVKHPQVGAGVSNGGEKAPGL